MRRIAVIALLVITTLASAQTITVVGARGGVFDVAWALMAVKYPGLVVQHVDVDAKTGETITMDALVAAGKDPDIYFDFIGRAAKYRRPEWALVLEIDEEQYKPDILATLKTAGKLLALPHIIPGQGMVLQTSALRELGIAVPAESWTIDDFRWMARRTKAGGYVPTVLFAANPSGDYMYVNWFGSFGAKFYDANYTRCTLDTPQGLMAFRWLKEVIDQDWALPGAAVLTDDDACAAWQTGKIIALGMRPSWVDMYQKPAIASGITKGFDTQLVPFPRDPTIAGTPTIGGGAIAVIHKTSDPIKIKILTDCVLTLTGQYMQLLAMQSEGVPTRWDVMSRPARPGQDVVDRIVNRFGWMDVGYAQPWYYEVRAALPEILGRMYSGKITAERAQRDFVAAVNRIMGQ